MNSNENFFNTLQTLLNDPQTRDSVIGLVEKYKNGDPEEKKRVTDLAVEEIYNYLKHVEIVALMKKENKGDATKYSALSFGDAVSATYEIDPEGNVVINADFSTQKSRYPGEKDTFDRRIDPTLIDADAVREGLMTKYGVEFGLTYKEETFTKEEWNGSGDMESCYNMTHYNIESRMMVKGKVRDKEIAREASTIR